MVSSKKLYSHSLYAIFSSVSRMALSLLSVPMTIEYLGKERYGLWSVSLTFISIINLLDSGITPTLKNRMTSAYAVGNNLDFKLFFKTGIFFGLILFAFFLCSIIPLFLIKWEKLFNIQDVVAIKESSYLMIVVSFVSISTLILSNIESFYASKAKLGEIKVLEAILNTVTIFLMYGLINADASLPLLAFVYASPLFFVRIVYLFKIMKMDRSFFILKREDMFTINRELKASLKVGSSFLGVQICEALIVFLPNIVIAQTLSLTDVSDYNIVYKIMSLPLLLIASVLPIVWPSLTIAWTNNDREWILRKLKTFIMITILLFIFFLGFMLFFGPNIIRVWTKSAIMPSYFQLSSAWLIAFILGITYWLSTFLHSIGDFKFELKSHILIVLSIGFFGYIITISWGLDYMYIVVALSWLIFGMVPMFVRVRNFLI